MVFDPDKRLSNLRDRRQGLSVLRKSVATADAAEFAARTRLTELYERRSSNKATRYALGAMQEVDPDYTANSVAEGDRVKNQLAKNLAGEIPVAFEYQGSVPLNVHIRGVSDIDLLILRTDFVTIDLQGPGANTYSDWTGAGPADLLSRLRTRGEVILQSAFPEADVVTSGAKSIAISGGSLRRKVDVVPSHWHDTARYQAHRERKDRGVCILVRDERRTMQNLPFLHIHEIQRKDLHTGGGAKKVVRLLKNLRNDSDYAESIKLSSYETAGIVWHFHEPSLTVHPWAELSLLATAKQNLDAMVANKDWTMRLPTPDGSRRIIDTEEKFRALVLLSLEVDQLAEAVAGELHPSQAKTADNIRKGLREAYVPVP
jgi:hypothetical protein